MLPLHYYYHRYAANAAMLPMPQCRQHHHATDAAMPLMLPYR
jgi:hypothetical protein